ncbi:hypothetical protein SPRG_13899, partial [Saprolegnia parasitica CBS 223.65]
PTSAPTAQPTPTSGPTPPAPTTKPTSSPTTKPTSSPTTKPTARPTTKPTTSPTSKPTTKPTNKPTPTSKPSGVVKKRWEQCGGKDYKGSSQCADGTSCFKQDEWYSQCIPLSNSKNH